MLAFCNENAQEGCRLYGNPAVFFSLNDLFHRGFGAIMNPVAVVCEMQIGAVWMLRVTTAAPSYKPVCHKLLSLCPFPMLPVAQNGSDGERINAGLIKSSLDYTEAERNLE